MEIYLIRHTTPDIEKGICYGQTNIGVTNSFFKEVDAIKKQLSENKNYKVYSSPLFRCYKLATELGNPIFTDSRLKELNFGKWENIPWDNIPKKEIDPWMKDFVTEKPTEGESYIELKNRVIDFFNSLTKEDTSSKKLIIVCHAGPMRAFLSHIQNIDLKDSFTIKIDYGQVFKIKHTNNAFSLVS